MMNVKVLMLLKSDCGNYAMIKIHNELRARGIELDVCSMRFSENDLHEFGNIHIRKISEVSIDAYDALIITRNIYDYPLPLDKVIRYRGIIFADDTTFYEGDDVFGDVVFTSGTNNYDILLRSKIELPVIPVGCVKSKLINCSYNEKKIVWLESGHFPFGEAGRKEIASIITSICEKFPEYKLIIKPRYLPKDCVEAVHYNTDHIYNYLSPMEEQYPNLELIRENAVISDVIYNAQIVMHTYSSAFQEAYELNKEIINIGDIVTNETVDLRNNRYGRIKNYIDRAQCTISKRDVLSILPRGHIINKEFDGVSTDTTHTPAQKMVDYILEICEQWDRRRQLIPGFYSDSSQWKYATFTENTLIEQRKKGALYHAVARMEFYLDDYDSFLFLREDIKDRVLNTNCIEYQLDDLVKVKFDYYNQSAMSQAFLMKRSFEKGIFNPDITWDNLLCQESFLLFSGLTYYRRGSQKKAVCCLKEYLNFIKNKSYAETLVDKPNYQKLAKDVIVDINRGNSIYSKRG